MTTILIKAMLTSETFQGDLRRVVSSGLGKHRGLGLEFRLRQKVLHLLQTYEHGYFGIEGVLVSPERIAAEEGNIDLFQEQHGALNLSDERPGASDQEISRRNDSAGDNNGRNPTARSDDLAEEQYRIAKKEYPDEYVVFCGTQIVFHSGKRAAAFRAYDASFSNFSNSKDVTPVIVEPRGRTSEEPIFRGRTLTK